MTQCYTLLNTNIQEEKVPLNEVLFVSSTIHAFEIRVNSITLFCEDDHNRQISKEDMKQVAIDYRDNGPDTYTDDRKKKTLLLRRPSYDAITKWFQTK